MLKSVVLCVLAWHAICEFSVCAHSRVSDTQILHFPGHVSPKIHDTDAQGRVEPKVNFIFNITQIFSPKGPLFGISESSRNLTKIDHVTGARLSYEESNWFPQGASPQAQVNQSEATPSTTAPTSASTSSSTTCPEQIVLSKVLASMGYHETKGIGAHKLHTEYHTSWSNASEICMKEGGELAVIRSKLEEDIVKKMLLLWPFKYAWVGFRDESRTGDWISAFHEPPSDNGWASSQKDFSSGGCGLYYVGKGLVHHECHYRDQFVCKIATV